ncbi:NADP-dependent oxidoreductase [Amycolatopsis thermophila]|uniref:NADPH:quinone reductase-like Zn-dependent oxidoreductase n=1 Tax=Amycolatopsis thermophila TaxID=206084 RepID=A0ABU0F571_9PSEU|nr:NADP-dependent oxidoreductase [Amycolatopsis thermophila]MDQ0382691.1 NADPH:quinone reductase-like Zn-dependent oxidoreductase [Amycolatopsis thermophila]
MRAIGLDAFGGPEVLRAFDLPVPAVGPGEIRIRVAAATVNPADLVFRAGARSEALGTRTPPHVPGMEAAGTVDAVGEGVPFAPGDRVMAIVSPFDSPTGAYAEQVVVPAEQAVVIPADLDFAGAATLPMNGMTAALALEALGLEKGATVGVTGAAGAVGGLVVQLAHAAGLVVLADAAPADVQRVRALGADHVVERGDAVAAHLRAVAPDGVDGLVDCAVQDELVDAAIRDGGVLACVRPRPTSPGRGIERHHVFVTRDRGRRDLLERVRDLAAAGVLRPLDTDVRDAVEASAAHDELARGGVRGRIVLRF